MREGPPPLAAARLRRMISSRRLVGGEDKVHFVWMFVIPLVVRQSNMPRFTSVRQLSAKENVAATDPTFSSALARLE